MRTRTRIILLVLFVVAVVVLARLTGLTDYLTVERIRALGTEAGAWGILAFVGAFTVGIFVHLPGWVFLSAAAVAYGPLKGATISVFAGVVAVTVTFCVVRAIGGKALAEIKNERFRKILAGLDRRPIRTIVILRTFMMVSPPLNYALALSPTSFRAYVVGSAVGLVVPIFVATYIANFVITS